MMKSADLTLEDIFLKITMGDMENISANKQPSDKQLLDGVSVGFDVSGVKNKNKKNKSSDVKIKLQAEKIYGEGEEEEIPETDEKSDESSDKNKNGGNM